MVTQLADLLRWVAAVFAGVAPRRLWSALDRHLPMRDAAAVSGLATMLGGFMTFATTLADANNTWMLTRLAGPPTAGADAVGLVPYGISVLTLFIYLLSTPRGLLSSYLVVTGLLRAIAASVDDPFGDPLLSGADWATVTLFQKNRDERRQIARTRLEGEDAPDVLHTGDWAGLPDADYVVLAARRKEEWHAGAIILTSRDWYTLGVPFDIPTPGGLRTAYPLKKMATVEVVRRGIHYELPRLRTGRSPRPEVCSHKKKAPRSLDPGAS